MSKTEHRASLIGTQSTGKGRQTSEQQHTHIKYGNTGQERGTGRGGWEEGGGRGKENECCRVDMSHPQRLGLSHCGSEFKGHRLEGGGTQVVEVHHWRADFEGYS